MTFRVQSVHGTSFAPTWVHADNVRKRFHKGRAQIWLIDHEDLPHDVTTFPQYHDTLRMLQEEYEKRSALIKRAKEAHHGK